MTVVLVVEDGTGRANANTFQSVNAVTARLSLLPSSWSNAWTDAASDTDRQEQLCAEATAWIGRLSWDGVRTFETQALAFPRAWLQTPDGYAIASNAMPDWLLDGHARLCNWLAGKAASPFKDTGLQPGTPMTLPGGLSFTPASNPNALPPEIRSIFAPYTRRGGTLVRG